LANRGVRLKLKALKNSGSFNDCFYDALIFKKTKAVLGGKVRMILTGSAPVSSEVVNFLKIAFCCPILEGYGQTEGCGAEFVQEVWDTSSGNVGGILPINEFKLIDVPEMNYTSKDVDENGFLASRGEILVRGLGVIPGYYKNPSKTAEAIDSDGWLHSGDIGCIIPGSNCLKIVDRVKNIFKLSQGEYVAPDRLEQIFKTAMGVADIYVYGDSYKSHLVAVVNIDPAS
jgi:long-chain acyl-CoA synthetase